jgi:hypothetical protein
LQNFINSGIQYPTILHGKFAEGTRSRRYISVIRLFLDPGHVNDISNYRSNNSNNRGSLDSGGIDGNRHGSVHGLHFTDPQHARLASVDQLP